MPRTLSVVCDTAKVRFFKQITTKDWRKYPTYQLFAILQKYDFSSKSQLIMAPNLPIVVVCDTAKVRFFKQITTSWAYSERVAGLFAILQKYDFSSKSQHNVIRIKPKSGCLRYCKSTIFQANHNPFLYLDISVHVVCDTAKVRFFKQITTKSHRPTNNKLLFAILQKYDFSSKSQRLTTRKQR